MARLGLDIGSCSTVVWDTAGGFLLDEPSVMLDIPHGGGTEIGCGAAELVDRLPAGAQAVRPVLAGVVTDLDGARRYVRAVLRRVLPRPWQRTRLSTAVVVRSASPARGSDGARDGPPSLRPGGRRAAASTRRADTARTASASALSARRPPSRRRSSSRR
ncbi:rod shape-determining protein [Pseudonocardia dioxanivorans]|uniref:rod shape-determining protein n=1 Tax=Pseudonocardia dioxanivorans TaxID=240495 RepID=UPI001F16C1F7|nr:rod shape-determining protein [Pseudonocardia dioxanivorans]